jgi:hypothetical protein
MTDHDVISLKEYIDLRFGELEKQLEVRFDGASKALTIAANNLETRLEGLNEFRSQIQEERNLYARKDEMNLQLEALREKVTFAGGKTAGKEYMIGLFVAIGLGVAALIVNILT